MSPESFTYWLQGFVELGGKKPNDQQWKMIKEHLALVFKKETPTTYCAEPPKENICGLFWDEMEKRPDIFGDIYKCHLHDNNGTGKSYIPEGYYTGNPPILNPTIITDGWVPITC
jgi:hypothetical protein